MAQDLKYLQSLKSIRDRCEKVYSAVKSGHHESRFDIDETKLELVADYVSEIIRRDYANPKKDIPPHSRWRHFLPAGSIESSIISPLKSVGKDEEFVTKSLLDLFVVSVLLDAGAGDRWSYQRNGQGAKVGRSEGLAMASMDMFINGVFSSQRGSENLRVDADALINLSEEDLSKGLQVDPVDNPLIGLKGRLDLLKRLGNVLKSAKNQEFFYDSKDSSHRPGNLIYFLLSGADAKNCVEIETLWRVVIEGFGGVWPEEGRIKIGNVCLGDVWSSKILNSDANESDAYVTFHKLSQWLTYSLIEPIEMFMKIEFLNKEQMTGLAEYRNGGLFVDLGVLKVKDAYKNDSNEYLPNDEVIIQWRALTICLLDRLAPLLRFRLQVTREEFSLPKMLEGGTWKAGRIIAKEKRPDNCGPPIKIVSDGTLF